MYKKIEDIPLHCFSNKECTMTPSPELREYLWYMSQNHPNDLDYIYRYHQKYKDHGGCYVMTYAHWLKKLIRDLTTQREGK